MHCLLASTLGCLCALRYFICITSTRSLFDLLNTSFVVSTFNAPRQFILSYLKSSYITLAYFYSMDRSSEKKNCLGEYFKNYNTVQYSNSYRYY